MRERREFKQRAHSCLMKCEQWNIFNKYAHYHQDSVDFHPPLWHLVYNHFQHERTISVLHRNHFFKLKVKSWHRYTSSRRATATFILFILSLKLQEVQRIKRPLCVLNPHTEFAGWMWNSPSASLCFWFEGRRRHVSSIHLLLFNLHTCQVETGQRADTAIYHNAASCDTETLVNFTVTFYMFRQFCAVTLRFVSQVTVLQYMTEMQRIMTSCLYSRARCVQC